MLRKHGSMILLSLGALLRLTMPVDAWGQTQPVGIDLEAGGSRLQGRFFPAPEIGSPTVLLLPDLPGSDVMESAELGLGTVLSEAGINVLTLNYRGTHLSEGAFTLSGVQQDVDAGRRWLRSEDTLSRFGVDPDGLIVGGYGIGGGLALAYSSTDLDITSAFSIAGFDQAVGIERYADDPIYAGTMEGMLAGDETVRWERGDFFAFIKEAMQGSGRWDLRLAAPQLARKRLLLVGALDDTRVPLEDHILPLYRTLRALGTGDLALEVYQDGHAFDQVRDELVDMLIDWIRSSPR
jgi:dienelactone hydrolase